MCNARRPGSAEYGSEDPKNGKRCSNLDGGEKRCLLFSTAERMSGDQPNACIMGDFDNDGKISRMRSEPKTL